MSVNAMTESYEHIELFGNSALFTDSRIDRQTVPEGLYCYDLRGSDYDPGRPVTVESVVGVNHAGTVVTTALLDFSANGYLRIGSGLNFLGEQFSIDDFRKEQGLNAPTAEIDEPQMGGLSY